MLLKPACLLKLYEDFSPACIDYLNISKAFALVKDERGRSFLGKLKRFLSPSKLTVDLGPVVEPIAKTIGIGVPEIKTEWERKNLEEEIGRIEDLGDVGRRRLYAEARKLMHELAKKGRYSHNVQVGQHPSADEVRLLGLRNAGAKPLLGEKSEDITPLVVDAMIHMTPKEGGGTEFELCDYPRMVRKLRDGAIPLKLSESAAARLAQSLGAGPGWHPYCRVLGVHYGLESPTYIEPLVVYVRGAGSVPESAADELLAEWDAEHRERIFSYDVRRDHLMKELDGEFMVKRANTAGFDIEEAIKNSRNVLLEKKHGLRSTVEGFRDFEDDIFAGPMGFLLGLYYFLGAYGGGKNEAAASAILYRLQDAIVPFKRDSASQFAESMKYLRPFDVLRFDDEVFDRILPLFDGTRVTGGSSTVL